MQAPVARRNKLRSAKNANVSAAGTVDDNEASWSGEELSRAMAHMIATNWERSLISKAESDIMTNLQQARACAP